MDVRGCRGRDHRQFLHPNMTRGARTRRRFMGVNQPLVTAATPEAAMSSANSRQPPAPRGLRGVPAGGRIQGVAWVPLKVSEAGVREFGADFWADFHTNPPQEMPRLTAHRASRRPDFRKAPTLRPTPEHRHVRGRRRRRSSHPPVWSYDSSSGRVPAQRGARGRRAAEYEPESLPRPADWSEGGLGPTARGPEDKVAQCASS